MRKYIKYLYGLCLLSVLGVSTTSCEDMLTPDSEHHSYEVAQDTLYSYWGIVRSLQNVAERYIVLGECRGDLVDGTGYISDSISAILNYDMAKATDGSNRYLKASDYYHIINSCNAYLASCDRSRTTGTLQPYMLKEAAQVEAIRAWVYLQLVQVYDNVPFYTTPLLTTDEIDAFMKAPKMVNAQTLVDELAPSLLAAQQIELQYGFPSYETYGTSAGYSFHSTKAMIPLNLVIADLYLAKGDKASCAMAAQYYYNYLSNNQDKGHLTPGGATPCRSYTYGFKGDGQDQPLYLQSGTIPWTERTAVSTTTESITSIPSSWNKLEGTILRGVNALYGFDTKVSVRTAEGDTVSNAAISIIPQYDIKQLGPSSAYNNLCAAQTYEVYIGDGSDSETHLRTDPSMGDARKYWVQDYYVTYANGLSNTEKFITKINPYSAFSSVAHVIYRKSQVWLRFAEALNRAGYPSYAFAILKNGFCNNSSWIPSAATDFQSVKDSAFYLVTPALDTIPADYRDEAPTTKADFMTWLQGKVTDGTILQTDIDDGVVKLHPLSYNNYPGDDCKKILSYLDKREVSKAPAYLNFTFDAFNSGLYTQSYIYRTVLTQRGFQRKNYPDSPEKVGFTMGIHYHGCGLVKFDDKNSEYNYVNMVIKKAKENYGVTLTKDQIYDGTHDALVQNCVEDLIVDEEALELAFEGTRFFDLMRVADRRGDPDYLARRVALRNSADGVTPDAALYSKLLSRQNWFFPLPNR